MMRRRLTAIALMVSFLAMSSSGLLMLVVDKPSFTIQMHPVHKLFGIVMIVAALSHLQLNARALAAHLKQQSAALWCAGLVTALIAIYVVVALNPVPPELAAPLDEAAGRAEHHDDDDLTGRRQ
jgi:L-asparagine transporter-like permease